MRKLSLILIGIILILSCSKDNSEENPTGILNPPEWILGKWSFLEGELYHSYTFSKDNIIEDLYGMQTIDWSTLYSIYDESVKSGNKIEEIEKSNEVYKVKLSSIVVGTTTHVTYTFQKGDGSYISMSRTPMNDEIIYTKH